MHERHQNKTDHDEIDNRPLRLCELVHPFPTVNTFGGFSRHFFLTVRTFFCVHFLRYRNGHNRNEKEENDPVVNTKRTHLSHPLHFRPQTMNRHERRAALKRYPTSNTSRPLLAHPSPGKILHKTFTSIWPIQKAPDFIAAPWGIRTPVFAVKGRCPRPLDEGRKSAATTSCSGLALKQVAGVYRASPAAASEWRLPLAGVRHRFPRLLRGLGCALLQELDGMLVGGAPKSHDAVARWPVDSEPRLPEPVAGCVGIIHLKSKMAKIAGFPIVFGVPVVSKFHLRARAASFFAGLDQFFVFRTGHEDQRVAVLLVDPAARLFHAELVTIKIDRGIEIADAQHGVQISHGLTSLTDE